MSNMNKWSCVPAQKIGYQIFYKIGTVRDGCRRKLTNICTTKKGLSSGTVRRNAEEKEIEREREGGERERGSWSEQ